MNNDGLESMAQGLRQRGFKTVVELVEAFDRTRDELLLELGCLKTLMEIQGEGQPTFYISGGWVRARVWKLNEELERIPTGKIPEDDTDANGRADL